MGKVKYSKELLEPLVREASTVVDVIRCLGLTPSGGNHAHISNKIKLYELDTNHFVGKSSNKGKPSRLKRTLDQVLTEVFIKDCKIKGIANKLRRIAVEYGIMEDRCYSCGIEPIWQGKVLIFEMHHIDGDRTNNSIINLQILCPNCHSQTRNYSLPLELKVRKYKPKPIDEVIVCKGCGIEFKGRGKSYCSVSCYCKSKRKVLRPSKKDLQDMIECTSFVALGKHFGVSDNAVRKWARTYALI